MQWNFEKKVGGFEQTFLLILFSPTADFFLYFTWEDFFQTQVCTSNDWPISSIRQNKTKSVSLHMISTSRSRYPDKFSGTLWYKQTLTFASKYYTVNFAPKSQFLRQGKFILFYSLLESFPKYWWIDFFDIFFFHWELLILDFRHKIIMDLRLTNMA